MISDYTLLMLLIVIPVGVTMALIISKIVQTFLGSGNYHGQRNPQAMEHRIKELEQRVENLETIITSIDTDLLEGVMKIPPLNRSQNSQQQAQRLAETAHNKTDIPLDENFKMVLNKILMKVDSFLEDKKKS
jgi:uncharacterized coiled-coil protein SlyX